MMPTKDANRPRGAPASHQAEKTASERGAPVPATKSSQQYPSHHMGKTTTQKRATEDAVGPVEVASGNAYWNRFQAYGDSFRSPYR